VCVFGQIWCVLLTTFANSRRHLERRNVYFDLEVLNHLCCVVGQAKFTKYSKLKEAGRSVNEDLRNSKGYRNPDFLQHAVTHENIDQIGSCFRLDIFNPHGYEKIDFFDALGTDTAL
jgi:hypothetical protein